MKVAISIDKVVALKAGKDRHGLQVVDVPAETLTAEQRETLAEFGTRNIPDEAEKRGVDFSLVKLTIMGYGTSPELNAASRSAIEPTPEAVCGMLDAIQVALAASKSRLASEEAAKATEQAEKEKAKATEQAGIIAELNELDDETFFDRVGRYGHLSGIVGVRNYGKGVEDASHLKARFESLDAANDARIEAEKKVSQSSRNTWIESHGSERLRRCLVEGIECEAVYRDERLAAARPGWVFYEDCRGRISHPRNPSDEAFALLDKAREFEPEATLSYLVADATRDEYGDEDEPEWRGYVADAQFLGKTIVYGHPDANCVHAEAVAD